MIVDAHCHVWPDDIAPKVLRSRPAGLDTLHDGTAAGLLRSMDAAGVDRALCLGVAATARTVRPTNAFIGALAGPSCLRERFVPFGTVHPELSPQENLDILAECGIVGVKLHPLFQELSLDDPRIIEIARGLAEAGLPVITHVGSGGDDESNRRGSPHALVTLLDAVPQLTVIACHFGGYHRLDDAEKLIVRSRAILETSWPPRLSELDAERVVRIIREHGTDRVVYGSDWPMADPAAEIATLRDIGLTEQEQDAVLGGNLARILSLT